MEERKNQLSEGWKNLASEKENLQNKISGYETEIELLKGKEISEVVSELAELEKDEAKLLEEEAQQLKEEKEQLKTDTVAASTDKGKLDELRKKVTEEKSKIAEDEEKLTKEKQELMQKAAGSNTGKSRETIHLAINYINYCGACNCWAGCFILYRQKCKS